jgi:hypothetical protein
VSATAAVVSETDHDACTVELVDLLVARTAKVWRA